MTALICPDAASTNGRLASVAAVEPGHQLLLAGRADGGTRLGRKLSTTSEPYSLPSNRSAQTCMPKPARRALHRYTRAAG